MKIVRDDKNGRRIIRVIRNKRKGIRLEIEDELLSRFCCDDCDLNTYPNRNSLCNLGAAFCDITKFEGITSGNIHFKKVSRPSRPENLNSEIENLRE